MERLTLRQREFYVRVSIFIRGFSGGVLPYRVFTDASFSPEQTKRCVVVETGRLRGSRLILGSQLEKQTGSENMIGFYLGRDLEELQSLLQALPGKFQFHSEIA